MGGNSLSTCNSNAAISKSNGCHANGGPAGDEPQPTTAYEIFMAGYRVARTLPCLGVRPKPDAPYTWRTYEQTLDDAMSFGAYLTKELGMKKGSFVGTMCANCPELVTLEVACYAYGFAIVPLYDTLGQEACQHIVEETDLGVVFCRGRRQVDTVASLGSKRQMRLLVADAAGCEESNVTSFEEIVARGKEALEKHSDLRQAPQPQDLAVICYTSGTTGRPKGVMLTNACLTSGLNLVRDTIAEGTFGHPMRLHSADVYFSYLPMAHILERMCQLYSLRHGLRIGFFGGDRQRLMDDLRACSPTFMAAVPKVVSRVYDVAHAGVAGSRLKSLLLEQALKRKTALVQQRQVTRASFWDKLVLHKVQEALGGRLRFMAVGGAPISEETLRFAKAAFGCAIVQGFGQTETCGLGLCQRPGDPSADNTGSPMLGVEVKLADVPDMGYFAQQGHGEICIRGACCFAGYYKQKDKTDEVLDSEGWVHTGDIAVQRADGSYRVVDRAKQMFKLAQGEYVAPEKVEMVYSLLPVVEQVFVDGSSEKSWLLGVVVPERTAAERWAAQHDMAAALFADICASHQFKQHVLAEMQAIGRERGLQGFEQVKDIVLHTDPFTPENNLLTPTMKMKRPQLRKAFQKSFDEMYARLEQ